MSSFSTRALMHSDLPVFPGKPMRPLGERVGYYMQNAPPMPSIFNGLVPPNPFCNVDIRPSDACPNNFIIFDQTNNRSQIMFHPETASRMFNHPSYGARVEAALFQDNLDPKDANDDKRVASSMKEDSDDIDALLSTEYEEDEESADDELSTARTNAISGSSSPDSCSNYEPASRKKRPFFRKLSHGDEKKRRRMREMVKALRGIVPGANRMSATAVLDEAVRYLKSLRVEVKKLGVRKSIN